MHSCVSPQAEIQVKGVISVRWNKASVSRTRFAVCLYPWYPQARIGTVAEVSADVASCCVCRSCRGGCWLSFSCSPPLASAVHTSLRSCWGSSECFSPVFAKAMVPAEVDGLTSVIIWRHEGATPFWRKCPARKPRADRIATSCAGSPIRAVRVLISVDSDTLPARRSEIT